MLPGGTDSVGCTPEAQKAPGGCVVSKTSIVKGGGPTSSGNSLHFGDNLDVLRRMPAQSVDLIYLDPPFNSNANYNVLYGTKRGGASEAQSHAFEDTWT